MTTDGFSGPDASDGGSDGSAADVQDAGNGDATDASGIDIVVTGQTGVTNLVASATDLYWTTPFPSASVKTCPLSSCGKPTTIASGGKPTAIAYSDRAFWGQDDGLSYATSPTNTAAHCVTSLDVVAVAAADGLEFYVQTDGVVVLVQSWASCGTTGVGSGANAIATKGGAFAWPATSSVRYCGKDGCPSTGDLVASDGANAVALDDAYLYWTTKDGRVRNATHDTTSVTGSPQDIATGFPDPAGVAPDNTSPYVYFTSRGTAVKSYLDGMVGKVAKSGGAVTVIASDLPHPEGIIVTATHVIWANSYDGTIRRAPK